MAAAHSLEDLDRLDFVVDVRRQISVLEHLHKRLLFRLFDQSLPERFLQRSLWGGDFDPLVFRKVNAKRLPAEFKREFKTLKHGVRLKR